MTSLSNNTVSTAATSTAKIKINPLQPLKSPTTKSFSNPLSFTETAAGNFIQHPELQQSNSTSNQLLTTSIIRKPITSSSTFDNKTTLNNINHNPSLTTAASSSSSLSYAQQQLQICKPTPLTAIPLTDPSSDLIKHSANIHNNVNVLNNATISQLPNNLDFDPNDGCTSYYSNNRTEVSSTKSYNTFFYPIYSLYTIFP